MARPGHAGPRPGLGRAVRARATCVTSETWTGGSTLRAAGPETRPGARHRGQEHLSRAGPQPVRNPVCGTTRVVPDRRVLRGAASARSPTRTGSGSGDFARPDRPAGLPAVAGRSTACGCRRSTRRPLRDGGYDISDYTAVLPEFGTLPEFSELDHAGARARHPDRHRPRHEPHQRPAPVVPGVSRTDPEGPYGDFYVWSDTDDQYSDARIIFVDTETSNWTFDPIRRQFFWHRFFSHQPDLNFENPRVRARRCSTSSGSGWTSASTASGSTRCRTCSRRRAPTARTSPETHEFLAELRAMVDAEYPGRILLAEANQSPRRGRRLLRHRARRRSATCASTSR